MNKLIGGILLVSGTTIGGAMLVLPVLMAGAGFVPSTALLLGFWFFMFLTAFLFLEVALHMESGANMVTMASATLGRSGKILSWFAYLFLLYCLTAAYLAGSGELIRLSVGNLFGIHLPDWMAPLPTFLVFGLCVYIGASTVDYVNRLFMLGLTVAFFIVIGGGLPLMEESRLEVANWPYLMISLPVVATAFGFHIVIPTLVSYLNRDVQKLKWTLLIGTSMPLVVYLLWDWVMLSVIPLSGGDHSLAAAYQEGTSVVVPLVGILQHSYVSTAGRFLHGFAIVTSFLGVTLSLSDFLMDGLKLDRSHSNRILVTGLTFIPPLLFVWTFPRVFVVALEYAAIFVAILLGILPIAMVWVCRYKKKWQSAIHFPGGRPLLVLAIVVFLAVIVLQLADGMGTLQYLNEQYLGIKK